MARFASRRIPSSRADFTSRAHANWVKRRVAGAVAALAACACTKRNNALDPFARRRSEYFIAD